MVDELKLVRVLKSLPLFAKNFLIIHDKLGVSRKFEFNRAQAYIHERIEAQLESTGMVRCLILKGRQQGVSTYVQSRFTHKIVTKKGKKAFILTHSADATRAIFAMTKRYSENLPEGIFPLPSKNNENTLMYDSLESGYRVGTAGNMDIGRSMTNQYLHLSEYAYYKDPESISLGLLQTVADIKGTEIIKESTANGQSNDFFAKWQEAKSGKSRYQAIFVPWYWQDEYKVDSETFRPTEEELLWLSQYKDKGLTEGHLNWRRIKLQDFKGNYEQKCRKFRQEYPFNDEEAFLSSVTETFIQAEDVRAARGNTVQTDASLVIGVDPARFGDDGSAIIRRRGRKAYNLEIHYNLDTMELTGMIRRIIDKEQPRRVFIDAIGIGAGVVDRLQELGYSQVVGVNVAKKAEESDTYRNSRAELWDRMREWLLQDMPVELPDDDQMQTDLTILGYKYDSAGRIVIESKDDARKRGCSSPDRADALALTFFGGEYLTDGNYKVQRLSENTRGMLI